MADENEALRQHIEEVFGPADDAFWEDPSIVIGSESDKARFLFENLKRNAKNWDQAGPCMYRGCSKHSIRRSHTVQKAGALQRISEAQHVLTPALDAQGHMSMRRVGVNLASTFPGFCDEHEQLFAEFESVGEVSSVRHLALQAFRTVSREVVRKRQGIAGLQRFYDLYREARERYYVNAMLKAMPGSTTQGITVTGDAFEQRFTRALEGARADLVELEDELYEELFAYITGAGEEPRLMALSLPFEVPVCCSGFGVLTYAHYGVKFRALCPLGVLPQAASTVVFIGAARKHSLILEKYFADMSVGFGALNAIESWLTNGSDHWFIRPSSWNEITATRQQKVFSLLMSDDDNIGTLLDFSILDSSRRQLIALVKEHLEEADDQVAVLRMLSFEQAKLAF